MSTTIPLLACLVEGSLLGLAFLLAWWWDYLLFQSFYWSWPDLGLGIIGSLPLFATYLWMTYSQWKPLQDLSIFFETRIVPFFATWHLWQFILISVLAGFGEELLFRDLLQGVIGRQFGAVTGLVLASILFGLAHAITATYAVLATLMGLWLGFVFSLSDNLLLPITAHAFYDAALLIYLTRKKVESAVNQGQFE